MHASKPSDSILANVCDERTFRSYKEYEFHLLVLISNPWVQYLVIVQIIENYT